MKYKIEEILYGPDLRFHDWQIEHGAKERSGGGVILYGDAVEAVRDDYPYGGGGDVETRIDFAIEPPRKRDHGQMHISDDWNATIQFNFQKSEPAIRGFHLRFNRHRIRVEYRGNIIGDLSLEADNAFIPRELSIVFATIDERFSLEVDGTKIVDGTMDEPFIDNEGWTRICGSGVEINLLEYVESAIVGDLEFPDWDRGEQLYHESFSAESLRTNWTINADSNAPSPVVQQSKYIFSCMSNAFVQHRFKSPIVVDFVVRPVVDEQFSSRVTDAILIWMADSPDGDLIDRLEQNNVTGTADLKSLLACPFYWVDFGGTNNNTTRLRKNPYRHLIRQYTDRKRLLSADHTYRITVVQNDHFLEFYVDGVFMIRCHDPHPLSTGHVGLRAFVAGIELSGLDVYRLCD